MTTERRITGPRLLALVLLCGLAVAAGRLGTAGLVRVPAADPCGRETGCDANAMVLEITCGLVCWLLSMVCAAALANNADEDDRCHRMSGGLILPVWLLLTLVGAYGADGAPRPWLLVPIGAFALIALLAGVPAERRVARETAVHRRARALARRLADHGVTVAGTVTALAEAATPAPRRVGLRLTVKYRTLDGEERATTQPGAFPAYALPRVGDRVTVRYDPRHPDGAEIAVRPPDEQSGDAVSVLARELERVAVLHREGLLDGAEFALAKARLLAPAPEAGYSTASR
ncbi:DUF3592 domain-containing protein [Kitasatospora sp. NPDC058201]|uniref:DUF3592 domain-containing protein n=1 Tax=unclassified Kitasatospora TaxID=2633591 RepID=UPI003669C5A9